LASTKAWLREGGSSGFLEPDFDGHRVG